MTNSGLIFIFICFLLLFRNQIVVAQYAGDNVEKQLDSLALVMPELKERLDLSVSQVPVNEFIRGMAHEAGLNINIDPSLNHPITNNFTNVQVKDLLVFLSRNYNIEISFIGNIIDIKQLNTEPRQDENLIRIHFNAESELVDIEVDGAPIDQVAREITRVTTHNVVVMPDLSNRTIRSFIHQVPVSVALDKLGVGNDFKVNKTNDGFYIFESQIPALNTDQQYRGQQQYSSNSSRSQRSGGVHYAKVWSADSIDVRTEGGDISLVVRDVLEQSKVPFYFIGEMTGAVDIEMHGASLPEFLENIFSGTKYVSRLKDDVYWLGDRTILEMHEFELVQMRYRSVDSVLHIIPESLKKGLEIKEYVNLNSLILAGPKDKIIAAKSFLTTIDRVIPVILIEVLIIDNKDSRALSTGITAGIGEAPETSQTVLPAVDLTLSSGAINELIDGFNGFGWFNLGKVNSNFYLSLQAMEEKGFIEMRSTPQLSTLNGHKATMSIGKTEYYKEELNVMYGSVTTSSQTTTSYKPVDAEFKLSIRPIVAGNREVTLDISVEQSDFTERIEKNAPPGKVTRKFESLIRVKDQEMILLGGLEEANTSDVRTGVPLISRIPVINWLFTSRSKSKSKSKLNIFIKPTIIY